MKQINYRTVAIILAAALTTFFLTPAHARSHRTLAQARAGFHTHLIVQKRTPDEVQTPPAGQFNLVYYKSPIGPLPAYVSLPPTSGKRYPAIIWIFGGFDNGIDSTAWDEQTPDNDQSASAFRKYGIVTMYPCRRGGNRSAGLNETLYGEVDDILAAYRWLAAQPYVDPAHIYLGGHSTGGTLSLLVAESTSRFRAVFSFGPVARIDEYGSSDFTFNYNDPREIELRSPINFLDAISKPTVVFEGTVEANDGPLAELNAANHNPLVHFYSLPGYTHFSELAYSTPLVASWIVQDKGATFHIPGASTKSGSHRRRG